MVILSTLSTTCFQPNLCTCILFASSFNSTTFIPLLHCYDGIHPLIHAQLSPYLKHVPLVVFYHSHEKWYRYSSSKIFSSGIIRKSGIPFLSIKGHLSFCRNQQISSSLPSAPARKYFLSNGGAALLLMFTGMQLLSASPHTGTNSWARNPTNATFSGMFHSSAE